MVVWCGSVAAYGQSDPQLNQYYELPSYYNPGAIGMSDYLKIRGGARLQWVGIDNAPRSFVATADMPVKLSMRHRMAIGAVVQQESFGLYRNITAGIMAGYRISVGGGYLTPGLRLGMVSETFKGSDVYLPDDEDNDGAQAGADEAIPMTDVNGTAVDIGLGVSYVKPRFMVGLSLLHANSPVIKFEGNMPAPTTYESESTDVRNYEFRIRRSLYFAVSGNIPVKNTLIEILPSAIAGTDFDDYTATVTMRGRYNRFLSAGVGYRWKDGIILCLGVEYRNFYLGYGYEYPLSDISKASSGSHEIMAGYSLKIDLGDKNRFKQKSIRIM